MAELVGMCITVWIRFRVFVWRSKYQYVYNSVFSMGVNEGVAVHARASVYIDASVRLLYI